MKENVFAYQILDIYDLEGEVWKTIEDYPNYMISNCGRVKALNYHRTSKPQILKQAFNGRGYLFVILHKDGRPKKFYVHRLVANAFIPNTSSLLEVNHRDEIKVNNCATNLEWCTCEYNNNYGSRNKRAAKAISKALKGKLINHPNLSKQITMVDPITKIGRKWLSSMQAEREGGFDNGTITKCCKGNRKTHKGYEFSYFQPPAIVYKGS